MSDSPAVPEKSRINPALPRPSDSRITSLWQGEFHSEPGAFRLAFEHAAIGMALVNVDGQFLKVNRALCQIVGYSEPELLARDFQSITHRDDLDADLSLSRQLLQGEIDHFHMEKRYLHKDGRIIWILLSAAAVRDEQGRGIFCIAQIQDITARKRAEQELARHVRHIERLTHTAAHILDVLESTPGDALRRVLEIALPAFSCHSGWFLRLASDELLAGTCMTAGQQTDVECKVQDWCDAWRRAIELRAPIVENYSRPMHWNTTIMRSLVAPILYRGRCLGMIHLGDKQDDFDDDDRDLLVQVCDMIAPVLAARLQRDKLTPREAEVMDLIVSGKSQKEIASLLSISIQTAAKHRSRLLAKLNVENDVQLVKLALQRRTRGAAAALLHTQQLACAPDNC